MGKIKLSFRERLAIFRHEFGHFTATIKMAVSRGYVNIKNASDPQASFTANSPIIDKTIVEDN